jgi:hypothetical protein
VNLQNAQCNDKNKKKIKKHEIHFKSQFGKVPRKFRGVEGNMTDPMTQALKV